MKNNLNIPFLNIAYYGLVVLALGIFVSVSFSAISHVLLLLSGLYFFIQFLKGNSTPFKMPKSGWWLLGIVLSIVVSVLFNLGDINNPMRIMSKSKYFLIPLISLFAIASFDKKFFTDKKIKILLYLFLIGANLATISGLIGLYTGYNPIKMKAACHLTRTCGLYGMYMTYGYGISLFCTLLFGMCVLKDFFKIYINQKWLYISFLINFIGLYLSYTRGGLLAFLISCPFLFYLKNKKLFIKIISILVIIFLAAIGFSSEFRRTFLSRQASNEQRISFYKAAWHGFLEKPVFGLGYRNFEPQTKRIKKQYNLKHSNFGGHAHNNYLEHLASTGVIGALFFILFVASWFLESIKYNDPISSIVFIFVINFSISGLFQYTFGDGENLFLIMGIWLLHASNIYNRPLNS